MRPNTEVSEGNQLSTVCMELCVFFFEMECNEKETALYFKLKENIFLSTLGTLLTYEEQNRKKAQVYFLLVSMRAE